MFASLADPILPIFAILALGYLLHELRVFEVAAARSINRFVFYVATPALLFAIVSAAPVADFEFAALAVYFAAQMFAYLGTFLFTFFRLGLDRREALLLGMTSAFVNHVFFVLPIAQRIYGDPVARPIAGIVLVDVVVLFCGTVLVMDLMQTAKPSPAKVLGLLARNPFLLASLLGMASWWAAPAIPGGVHTFAGFAGAAAAPASLFALGIVLASNALRPVGAATWTVVVVKNALHPLLVLAFSALVTLAPSWDRVAVLVAAGPCGAMPFVIALQYGVRTDVIARAILLSTVFSLVSLALLTA